MPRILLSYLTVITFLLSALCAASNAYALEQYAGELRLDKMKVTLVSGTDVFEVKTPDSDLANSIQKLRSGDLISGLGEFGTDKTILIQSIDYIGLKQLLGSWKTDDNIYAVVPNFTELNLVAAMAKNEKATWSGTIKRFVYSVRPATQSGFTLFLTDDHQTRLSEININGKYLSMKIFDPENGYVQSQFRFTKQ